MHVTQSSLQVVTLPSAVEAGLSKCTALQRLTVEGSLSSILPPCDTYYNPKTVPPSVTASLLKAVIMTRSLEEVSLVLCDFGM